MKNSTKIIQKSAKTTPFAGILFIEDYFDRYKIGELCDEVLGKCAKQAEYSYADIIKSLWMIALTGGQALEDINNQTGSVLKLRPGAHVPNADPLGYALKKLADKEMPHEKIHFQVRQRGGQMGQACKAERPDLVQRRAIQPAPMLKNSFLLVKKTTQMIWVGEVMPAFNLDSKLNFTFLQL